MTIPFIPPFSSNPVILPLSLAISHVQPSHTSVYAVIDPSP